MAVKAVNYKLDEDRIAEIKNVANIFKMSMTDVVNEALDAYLAQKKKDPFYRLTCNARKASKKESVEILEALNSMSDDDLEIVQVKRMKV